MKWIISKNTIIKEIETIEKSFLNNLAAFNKIISYCHKILENYRKHVAGQGFDNEESEIKFFKYHKQVPLTILFQYNSQLNFEMQYHTIAKGMDKDFIVSKIQQENLFISRHQEFMMYIKLDCSNFDSQYFLRKNKKMYDYHILGEMTFDSNFSTSHDILLAKLNSSINYQDFLQRKLNFLLFENQSLKSKTPNLKWTGSKAALTELAIALHHSGSLNYGNNTFKDTVMFLQNMLGIDLGEFNHTAMRLKNRSNPTKYIDKLKHSLDSWIEELDD